MSYICVVLIIMQGNLKILLLSLTLALFLMPGISFACSKKDKQLFKTQAHAKNFIKQSFAKMKPSCESGDCKDQCCYSKSQSCKTEKCTGDCCGDICGSAQNNGLANSKFLEDYNSQAIAYDDKNSNFYYQNPHYSVGFHTIWQPPKIG